MNHKWSVIVNVDWMSLKSADHHNRWNCNDTLGNRLTAKYNLIMQTII